MPCKEIFAGGRKDGYSQAIIAEKAGGIKK